MTDTLAVRGSIRLQVLDDLAAGVSKQWVQVMVTTDGAVKNGDSSFVIDPDDLEVYAASIRKFGERIPVDYDHSYAEGSGTLAAGWFTGDAEVRGDQLWAEIEWTPVAAEQIRNKQFKFLSPEFTFQGRDKQGVLRKAADILAAALTNRPFFNTMAPVTAAKEVPKMTAIAKALGLDENADETTITAALAAQREELEQAKADVEKITAQLAARPDLKPDDLKSLIASAAKGEQAATELHDMKREALLKEAVIAGKILPVQKDAFASMYNADPKGVTALIEATPEKSFDAKGSGATGGAADAPTTMVAGGEELPVKGDTADLHAKAVAVLAAKGKSLDKATEDEYLEAVAVARVSTD